MNYITWLNIKATLIDVSLFILNSIKWIFVSTFMLTRFLLYGLLSVIFMILSVAFPLGIYFCITVVSELFKGIAISETTHFGFFLLFFVSPLVVGIIREIVKP